MSFKTSISSPVAEAQYSEKVPTGDGSTTEETSVEAPFTEYRNVNKLPLTAEYVDAKLTWDQAGMVEDVTNIEEYLTEMVNTGKLENSVKSAKGKLKELEKMSGIDKLESQAQRLIKLSEFVTYLKNLDKRLTWQA